MDFASRISVTCFVASYAVSLGGELVRIFRQSRWARWVATGGALAGIFAQTLYLLAIGLDWGRLPINSQFTTLITVSWLISLIYIYLLLHDRRLVAGIFILPVSIGLCLYAATLSPRGTPQQGEGNRLIGVTHGILLLVGTALVIIAFVAALMYLVKYRQLKSGRIRSSLRLPSLEKIDRMHGTVVYLAWPLLTLGIGLGLSLRQLHLLDPKVLTTILAWGVFTFLVHCRYRPENRGRKLALLTIVAFVVVLVSVLGDPIFGTGHQPLLEAAP
ncbi:Cytochrome c biogenesis protein CcsA [Planctomycetes bacterium Pan216]|uniref:Cytochrome c biogenesis protein CcsA n=1 Tax=Kolteria novifilia TaxID=2527975 RepID=A0A518B1Z1_9BACT|nr:Cytochrome c biogenesis protein CcsA [Planctomycetes bacterium Pan216]